MSAEVVILLCSRIELQIKRVEYFTLSSRIYEIITRRKYSVFYQRSKFTLRQIINCHPSSQYILVQFKKKLDYLSKLISSSSPQRANSCLLVEVGKTNKPECWMFSHFQLSHLRRAITLEWGRLSSIVDDSSPTPPSLFIVKLFGNFWLCHWNWCQQSNSTEPTPLIQSDDPLITVNQVYCGENTHLAQICVMKWWIIPKVWKHLPYDLLNTWLKEHSKANYQYW